MKSFLKITAFFMMAVLSFSTLAHADRASGGGDDLEGRFAQAKLLMLTAVASENATARFSQDVLDRVSMELNSLQIEFDHKTIEPFVHGNGSKTWIKSQRNVRSPILVRSKAMESILKKIPLSIELVSYLGHEIGHNIYAVTPEPTAEEEEKSWGLGAGLEVIIRKMPMKAPALLNVGNGDYQNIGSTCYKNAHIESDPISGVVTLSVNSKFTISGTACPTSYNAGPGSASPIESRTLVFKCLKDQVTSRTLCEIDASSLSQIEQKFNISSVTTAENLRASFGLEILPDGNFIGRFGFLLVYGETSVKDMQFRTATYKYARVNIKK